MPLFHRIFSEGLPVYVLALWGYDHYIYNLCLCAEPVGQKCRHFDSIGGHEENLSAESSEACQQARISLTYGNPWRPQADCASPGARTRPTECQRFAVQQVSGSTRTRAPSTATPIESEASQVDSGAIRSVPIRKGVAGRRVHSAGLSSRERCGSFGGRPRLRRILTRFPHSGCGQAESNQASSTRMLQTGAWYPCKCSSRPPGGADLDGCLSSRFSASHLGDQGRHQTRDRVVGLAFERLGLSYFARQNG